MCKVVDKAMKGIGLVYWITVSIVMGLLIGCSSVTGDAVAAPDASIDMASAMGGTAGAAVAATGGIDGAAGAPGTGGQPTATGGAAGHDAGPVAPSFCPTSLSAYSATSTDGSTVYYPGVAVTVVCAEITPPNWPSTGSVTFTVNSMGIVNPGPVAGQCSYWVEDLVTYTNTSGLAFTCNWRAETYFSINY